MRLSLKLGLKDKKKEVRGQKCQRQRKTIANPKFMIIFILVHFSVLRFDKGERNSLGNSVRERKRWIVTI
jgi:hypothetical protein